MENEKYKKGMELRRKVLGDVYVDSAIDSSTEFTKPLQDLVTENCWGEIWTKKAIPTKTRSLITIAILTALKAQEEVKSWFPTTLIFERVAPESSCHLLCFSLPFTMIRLPFLRYSLHCSASLDHVVTSKKLTSFCSSLSLL